MLDTKSNTTLDKIRLDMYNCKSTDYNVTNHDSLEDRCLAIADRRESENRREKTIRELPEQGDSISSIDLSQSKSALQRALAASHKQTTRHYTSYSEHVNSSDDGSLAFKDIQQATNKPPMLSQCSADKCFCYFETQNSDKKNEQSGCTTPLSAKEELAIAKQMITTLQNRIEKLHADRAKLREANQMWAKYAADLKSEQPRTLRCSSADDVRNDTSPKGTSQNSRNKTFSLEKYPTETGRSGDCDSNCNQDTPCVDTRLVESLRSQVTLLTQQVKIYRDDFALERRDRVRSVMEAKKYKKEVDRLKEMLAKQRQHTIKSQCLTCEDFDYLNQ